MVGWVEVDQKKKARDENVFWVKYKYGIKDCFFVYLCISCNGFEIWLQIFICVKYAKKRSKLNKYYPGIVYATI